ncbi:MAG: AfsA-related hotdog domain-containing protein [Mycobacterium sp.]
MQLLTPIAPRVIPGRAIDILNVAPSRGMSRGFACVDLSDPVFFDHPLDHVPGMLLTAAILELAEHDSILESDNVTFRLTFTRFCELNAPVQVTATREASGTNRIQVTQSGRNIATGLLGRRETQPLMERVTVPALEDAPVSSELVHRNIGFVGYFASPASVAALALLTAAMFWRIRVEKAVLVRSSEYREFASIRRRILPGVW